MKLTTVLLIATLLQVSATGLAQKITFVQKDATIKQVFDQVYKQTGYSIVWPAQNLRVDKKINANFHDTSLDDVMKQCLDNLELDYAIEDKSVVVSARQPSLLDKLKSALNLNNIDVQGRVVDEKGVPIPGATVRVKYSATVAVTDRDGHFSLKGLTDKNVLIISFIGYLTQEVPVSAKLSDIVLQFGSSKLDEVKVIAYGTTTERLSTGNVTTLNAADIEKQPVNNILDALAGRVAGMQITPTSGLAGAAPTVLIRGRSSLGNATDVPLFIVDGVPTTPSQSISIGAGGLDNHALNLLLGINPLDVESISVLKDADATAIYGSRGANGVILVTTKHGKINGLSVNINAYTGIEQVPHFIDLPDVHQYLAIRREAFKNDGTVPSASSSSSLYAPDLLVWDTTNTHNWQKEFLGRTAASNDVNFSLSGGNGGTHFYISSAYHREGSVMPGNAESDRKSFLASINHVSNDKRFTMNIQSAYSNASINALPTDLVGSIFIAPDYPLYLPDGTPNWTAPAGFPLAYTLQTYLAQTSVFSGNANLAYEFIPGLKAKINTGFNQTIGNITFEQPLASLAPSVSTTSGTLSEQNINNDSWIVEPQLEFTKKISKNSFAILVGSTFQKTSQQSLILGGNGFPNDALLGNIGSASSTSKTINSTYVPYAYNAFFGRISYDYNQEYLANITFRRDGSSRFGPGEQFGNFGALGLGWVFTREKAINDALPFLSFGKLRGSYGITGNDQIVDFGYIATVGTTTSGYNGQSGVSASTPANPDLQWETNKKLEVGLELGLLKDRIFIAPSYFRNRSSNQLISNLVSPQAGFFSYPANSTATVQNKGFEIEISSHNLQGLFTWNTNLNFTTTSNTLLNFPNLATSQYATTYIVGQSINILQAYQFLGLSATGLPLIKSAGASPVASDRLPAGNTDPMYGGMGNDFSYKGFGFSFFIQYTRFRGTAPYLPGGVEGTLDKNFSTYVLGRWQNPGDEANTSIPRFSNSNSAYQTVFYNGSNFGFITNNIFRLSNASLSYTIPNSITKKLKMSNLKIYTNAQNLYVFDKNSKYELDPQTGNANMPPLRTIVFGINASF